MPAHSHLWTTISPPICGGSMSGFILRLDNVYCRCKREHMAHSEADRLRWSCCLGYMVSSPCHVVSSKYNKRSHVKSLRSCRLWLVDWRVKARYWMAVAAMVSGPKSGGEALTAAALSAFPSVLPTPSNQGLTQMKSSSAHNARIGDQLPVSGQRPQDYSTLSRRKSGGEALQRTGVVLVWLIPLVQANFITISDCCVER